MPARRRRGGRRAWPALAAGSASMRNRKSGLTSSRSSATRMPVSKSPSARPLLKNPSNVWMSSVVGCRRYARRASVDRIFVAHAVSSDRPLAGYGGPRRRFARRRSWHTKMRRRLGESCGTWPLYGPPMRQERDHHRGSDIAVVVMPPDRNTGRSETLGLDGVGSDGGDRHLPETGVHRHPHFQHLVGREQRIARVRVERGRRAQLRLAAERELTDSLRRPRESRSRSERGARESSPCRFGRAAL